MKIGNADRNVDIALIAKETPAMDVTRAFIGYTPRTKFKRGYRKSIKMSNQKLLKHLNDIYSSKSPVTVAPYLYDAGRRGIKLPRKITSIYKTPGYGYMRSLNEISGEPAEKYVGANMTATGSLTGIAALDYVQEKIEGNKKRHPYSDLKAKSLSKVRQRVGDKVSYALRKNKRHFPGAEEESIRAVNALKKKLFGAKGKKAYETFFEKGVGTLISKDEGKKDAFIGRLIGTGGKLPLAGVAALPLTSRRVLSGLKGDDPESARYKTISWIDKHPGVPIAASFAPLAARDTLESFYEARHIVNKAKPAHQKALLKSLAGRTLVSRGKLMLGAIGVTSLIKMRRNMQDARDKESKMISKKLLQKHKEI